MTRSTLLFKAINIMAMLIFATVIMATLAGFSQNVSINTTGSPPNAAAGLDVDFSDKGLLIPRIPLEASTSSQPLQAHVAGMIIYNTSTVADVTPGLYYNNGSRWVPALPAGTAAGDLLYWSGSAWTVIPKGVPGQVLEVSQSNIPAWSGTSATPLHKVGDTYGGGIVFHVDSRGEHGLIVASENHAPLCQWGCNNIQTGAIHLAGISNTIKILAICTTTSDIAARRCDSYSGGGFTDWYLPSISELSFLYASGVSVSMSNYNYWSSTEDTDPTYVFIKSFNNGNEILSTKNMSNRVRAIRSF